MDKEKLKTVALLRATGKSAEKIGKEFGITQEWVRLKYYSTLNKMSVEDIKQLLEDNLVIEIKEGL